MEFFIFGDKINRRNIADFFFTAQWKKTLWSFNQKHAINFISGVKIQYQTKSQCGQSPDWIELN